MTSDGYPLGADCDLDAIVAFTRPAEDDPVMLLWRRIEAAFAALRNGDPILAREYLSAP